MKTGELNRAKKYNLEINNGSAQVVNASRGFSTPFPFGEKFPFGWHRKKQLAKVVTASFLKEGFIDEIDLLEHLMGERLIHPVRLIAIATGFNRSEWDKKHKNNVVFKAVNGLLCFLKNI